MESAFSAVWSGIKKPFRHGSYWILFLLVTLGMLVLFTLIPAFTVVGNTVGIQLSILTPLDGFIIVGLSLLYATFITMQTYVARQRKGIRGVGTAVGGGVGTLFAGIAGTAFCAACLAPLFALVGIGFGGVLFVLEHRLYFVIAIVASMLVAIYLASQRILQVCGK